MEWEIIREMDNEDGTHTCYCCATTLSNENKLFAYCTYNSKGTWNCEARTTGNNAFDLLHISKTLNTSKSWWKRNFNTVYNNYNETF